MKTFKRHKLHAPLIRKSNQEWPEPTKRWQRIFPNIWQELFTFLGGVCRWKRHLSTEKCQWEPIDCITLKVLCYQLINGKYSRSYRGPLPESFSATLRLKVVGENEIQLKSRWYESQKMTKWNTILSIHVITAESFEIIWKCFTKPHEAFDLFKILIPYYLRLLKIRCTTTY